jgi:serine protease
VRLVCLLFAVAFASRPFGIGAQSYVTPSLLLTPERVARFVEAHERKLVYLPGEVLIKFKPGMGPADQDRALFALRGRPSSHDLRWSGDVALLYVADQPDAHVLAEQLASQPEVEYAEPNYLRHAPAIRSTHVATIHVNLAPKGVPNDADYNAYQWNFQVLDMPKAWDINPGAAPSIIVANIDTGVTVATQTMTFPLFTGAAIQNVPLTFNPSPDIDPGRFVAPRDFVFFGAGGPVIDFDGHGTHTASTMAESTNNALALSGIAYNARIMPVKVCVGYWELMIARAQAGKPGFLPQSAGDCPDDAIQQGIRYAADNGAKVINISLGGPGGSITIRDAIVYAVQKGAFVAISMGNDGDGANLTDYPAGDAPGIDGAMSVAAVGKSLRRAYYSSFGSHCEIAAPGGDDTDGGGADFGFVWQTTLFFPDQDPALMIPRFDRLAEIGYEGTSMSAPHVAGIAALIMAQVPGITPAAVESLIKKTARDLGTPGKDNEFGEGLVQPRAALFGMGIKK